PDFMFRLTSQEAAALRSQIVTSHGRGGRRYTPYAFTEQGIAMLSSVLRSPRAVLVNIEIMRAFVRVRQVLEGNAELAAKIDALEHRVAGHNVDLERIFAALRKLIGAPSKPKRQIGFSTQRASTTGSSMKLARPGA